MFLEIYISHVEVLTVMLEICLGLLIQKTYKGIALTPKFIEIGDKVYHIIVRYYCMPTVCI